MAAPGQVLVGPSVAGKIGTEWLVEPMTDLVDLEGATLDGWNVVGPHHNGDPSAVVGESG